METYHDYADSLLHKEDSIVRMTCKIRIYQNGDMYCSDLDVCNDGKHRLCRLVKFCKRKLYYDSHPDELEKLVKKYQ